MGAGLSWLPTYHDMGLIGGILQPMFYGRPSVLMSPMAFLQKPIRWLRGITKYRVTISGGPNFAYDLCADKITDDQLAGLDLSTLGAGLQRRRAGAGRDAAPDSPSDSRRTAFGPRRFYPCYGMAETTLIVTGGYKGKPPGRPLVRRPPARRAPGRARRRRASAGAARSSAAAACCPTRRCVIVDPETLRELPPDQIGEIWVNSPSVAQGYWNKAEATEATFQARIAGRQRQAVPAHRRPGLLARRRAVRHRPAQGPDHRPRRESLSAGHRDDRRAGQSADSAAGGRRVRRRSGRARAADHRGRGRAARAATTGRDVIAAVRSAVTAEHELPPDAVVLVRSARSPRPPAARSSGTPAATSFWPARCRSWPSGGPGKPAKSRPRRAAAPPQAAPAPDVRQGSRRQPDDRADRHGSRAGDRQGAGQDADARVEHRHRPGARFARTAADRQLAGRDLRRPLSRGRAGRDRNGSRSRRPRSRPTSAPSRACSATPLRRQRPGPRAAKFRPNATDFAQIPEYRRLKQTMAAAHCDRRAQSVLQRARRRHPRHDA